MSFGSSNSPPEMSSRFGVDLLRGMTSAPAVEVKKGTLANFGTHHKALRLHFVHSVPTLKILCISVCCSVLD